MNENFLNDRMKLYEGIIAEQLLIPRLPVLCRLDGKNFSTWTKDLKYPYDYRFRGVMVETMRQLMEETNALCGFTQSDEITIMLYTEQPQSQIYFNGRIQKLTSVLASMATAFFSLFAESYLPEKKGELAFFDCRVWNVPNLEEASNVFVWRELDATRNSISMAASTLYSHKELLGRSSKEQQEMLFQKGVNWNDYPDAFKRGSYILRQKVKRELTDEEKAEIPEKYRPAEPVERNEFRQVTLPPILSIANRVGVLFRGEEVKKKNE